MTAHPGAKSSRKSKETSFIATKRIFNAEKRRVTPYCPCACNYWRWCDRTFRRGPTSIAPALHARLGATNTIDVQDRDTQMRHQKQNSTSISYALLGGIVQPLKCGWDGERAIHVRTNKQVCGIAEISVIFFSSSSNSWSDSTCFVPKSANGSNNVKYRSNSGLCLERIVLNKIRVIYVFQRHATPAPRALSCSAVRPLRLERVI